MAVIGTARTIQNVKMWPEPNNTGVSSGLLAANTIFAYCATSGTWYQMESNKSWVNGGSSGQYIVKIGTVPVDPPAGVTVTHTIEIDNTGRISVDGGAYV